MADTFTNKLEQFFDNNTPGGYITTTVNISDSDLDNRINENINGKGYLTSVNWEQILQKPTFSEVAISGSYGDLINAPNLSNVAISGDYNDLINKPIIQEISIDSTLSSGTKIGTIYINNEGTDLYAPLINGDGEIIGGVTDYNDLINKPSYAQERLYEFSPYAFTGQYKIYDLLENYHINNFSPTTSVQLNSNELLEDMTINISFLQSNPVYPILKYDNTYYICYQCSCGANGESNSKFFFTNFNINVNDIIVDEDHVIDPPPMDNIYFVLIYDYSEQDNEKSYLIHINMGDELDKKFLELYSQNEETLNNINTILQDHTEAINRLYQAIDNT